MLVVSGTQCALCKRDPVCLLKAGPSVFIVSGTQCARSKRDPVLLPCVSGLSLVTLT